jgi:hypothetical protein
LQFAVKTVLPSADAFCVPPPVEVDWVVALDDELLALPPSSSLPHAATESARTMRIAPSLSMPGTVPVTPGAESQSPPDSGLRPIQSTDGTRGSARKGMARLAHMAGERLTCSRGGASRISVVSTTRREPMQPLTRPERRR